MLLLPIEGPLLSFSLSPEIRIGLSPTTGVLGNYLPRLIALSTSRPNKEFLLLLYHRTTNVLTV